jgi:predicted transcriptional regulator
MNGELPNGEVFELGKQESQLPLSVKAGVGQAASSRILAGRSHPDISTISNLEFYTRSQL